MATINPTHAFNLASPYAAEMQEMQRRQQMSEMLQQQSQSPFERFSYQGIEAPIPFTAGLAKILQAYTGAKMQREGFAEQKALGERMQGDRSSDFATLLKSLQGRAAMPERSAMLDPQEIEQAQDQGGGNATGAYQIPAVAARAPGQIDPAMMSQLRTPEAQNQAMAMYMNQLAPKTLNKVGRGESLIDNTGRVVYEGNMETEYGQPQAMMIDGKPVMVVTDKQGNRKILEGATPQNQFTQGTVDAAANRNQDLFKWNNLSAEQRLSAEGQELSRRIQAASLAFNSGGVPGPSVGTGIRIPPNAPLPTPQQLAGALTQQGQPVPPKQVASTQPTQRLAPQGPLQPLAPQPLVRQPVAQADAGMPPGLTPNAQQTWLLDKAKAQTEARQLLPGIQAQANTLTNVIDQMIGKMVDGKLVGEHKGLRQVIGSVKPDMWLESKYASENIRNFIPLLEQIKGGAFLQAVQQMKGSGAISEIEGDKAASALVRASNAQTPEAFIQAMTEFRTSIATGVDIAKQKAGVKPSGTIGTWRDL